MFIILLIIILCSIHYTSIPLKMINFLLISVNLEYQLLNLIIRNNYILYKLD